MPIFMGNFVHIIQSCIYPATHIFLCHHKSNGFAPWTFRYYDKLGEKLGGYFYPGFILLEKF